MHDHAALAAAIAVWLRVGTVTHHICHVVFPGAEVVETHGVKIRFSVPQPLLADAPAGSGAPTAPLGLAAAFEAMAAAQDHLTAAGVALEAYSVSQVGLEQIFLDKAAVAQVRSALTDVGAAAAAPTA